MEGYILKGDAYIELMKCKEFNTDKLYHGSHYRKIACDAVLSIPPADVVERKNGKWIFKAPPDDWFVLSLYRCSQCNQLEESQSKYCPNCGAEMEGE